MSLADHPHIVKIYSAYAWKEKELYKLAIVMERCEADLESFIRNSNKYKIDIDFDKAKKWLT